MTAIIHAKCPSCRQTLRIPADWANASLKCKHCGTMFRAKQRPAAAPDSRLTASPRRPDSNPQIVAAQPNGQAAQTLAALDDNVLQPSNAGAGTRMRLRPSHLIPLLLGIGFFIIAIAVLASAFIVIKKLMAQGGTTASASSGGSESGSSSGSSSGRLRPGRSGRVTPPDQRTPLKGEFPNRRALIISANNYLYMNPTLYGATKGTQPQNISTLMERFRTGLRIPPEQMAQVSDAAPVNPIKPTKKAIEEAISQFLTGVREQDCLLLMFAGHVVDAAPADGMPEETCLVPLEGIPNDGATLIPLSGLLHQLELSPARQKVLILDVCRLNPARGLEFPGSGPADADTPGAMWEKLDKQMDGPPDGVQVWLSCLKDQFSYELEQDFNNSVFLNALDVSLKKIVEDKIQYPEEPMPLQEFVDLVNATVKQTLSKYTSAKDKRTQVSRLSGYFYDGGLTYDEGDEATRPLPKLTVTDPVAKGGAARPEDLRQILADMKAPPIRSSLKNAAREPAPPLDDHMLPFISADDLKDYLLAADPTPEDYRKEIDKARDFLKNLKPLDEELLAQAPPKTDKQYDDEVLKRQRDVATRQDKLEGLLKDMAAEDGKSRDKASKRWRANFDFLKSRVQAQLAYCYEVNSALGAARKKETPNLDKELKQNGWRMAATAKPQGDKEGKAVAKARGKLLKAMEEEYKNTPWEVVARREEFAALGVEWQPAQLAPAGK
jgi:hypothetical protein